MEWSETVVDLMTSGRIRKKWHGGRQDWIREYWLYRNNIEPFSEKHSIRQAFYKEIPLISKFVPEKVKVSTRNWGKNFYTGEVSILSDLVLDRRVSYGKINIFDDSGASRRIWQNIQWGEWEPTKDAYVEYPIEIWVENNATYNSLIPLFKPNFETNEEALFQTNLVSQRGFANTQEIEKVYLYREDDVKVILNLTDFDPAGYEMPSDLQSRFKRIGLDVEVIHIGIFPHQIPEERKETSLMSFNPRDSRTKKFKKLFADDELVQQGFGYEIQALMPDEIRMLVNKAITETIEKYGFEKREQPEEEED